MTNKNCECVCHTIVPLKRGEAYPVQFDRPVGCEHCIRSNNMTPQELIKEHICRFNDYPQKCECFIKGIQDFIDQEIELLEKEIDDNDDGMWTGREFADKWLAHLTSLKELIK